MDQRYTDEIEGRYSEIDCPTLILWGDKDQIIPVDPTKAPKLDQKLLARFPIGYRHLAYLQTKVGYKVKDDMPGVDGPGTDALYALGANWLKGGKKIGW